MRHLPVIVLTFVVIFASMNFTSALIGEKLTKYCKQTMGNATTHKVFCRAVSDRVTLKAYKVCRKGVTWACKGARMTTLVDYKECKLTLLKKICPDIDALSTTVAPGIADNSTPSSNEDTDNVEEEVDDFPEDESEEIDFNNYIRQLGY